jgi:hypothetical protein
MYFPGIKTFTGSTGPYVNYGRNAAVNKYTFGDKIDNLDDVPTPQVRLTRTQSLRDVLGYADQYNNHYDKDSVKGLNKDEYYQSIFPYSQLFNTDQAADARKLSDRWFGAVDQDSNSQFSAVENSAFQIFQNAPITWINRAVGNSRLPSGPNDIDDGFISARERENTSTILRIAPAVVTRALKYITEKLDLSNRYDKFLADPDNAKLR